VAAALRSNGLTVLVAMSTFGAMLVAGGILCRVMVCP